MITHEKQKNTYRTTLVVAEYNSWVITHGNYFCEAAIAPRSGMTTAEPQAAVRTLSFLDFIYTPIFF